MILDPSHQRRQDKYKQYVSSVTSYNILSGTTTGLVPKNYDTLLKIVLLSFDQLKVKQGLCAIIKLLVCYCQYHTYYKVFGVMKMASFSMMDIFCKKKLFYKQSRWNSIQINQAYLNSSE